MSEIKKVQKKILEVMLHVDKICRENNIEYFIMGGTALGAIRHKGFIPWDDDLDIFMTPKEYKKFKTIFQGEKNGEFILQEWRTTEKYLEYAKVRMNGTTFIEEAFKERKDLHQGIYIDIMMLHKCPLEVWKQKIIYYQSKYVTLLGLSQRNWKPKSNMQNLVLKSLKLLPNSFLSEKCYKNIYRYNHLETNFKWCYFITPAKFKQGVFEKEMFMNPINIEFEDTFLLGAKTIEKYLEYRYGDYMKLPSLKEQEEAVHAMFFDTEKDYREYFEEKKL